MTVFPTGILFEHAHTLLAQAAAAQRLPEEHLALARCHGRVLAQDIIAPIALQPFDNSAMGGYACRMPTCAMTPRPHCDCRRTVPGVALACGCQGHACAYDLCHAS